MRVASVIVPIYNGIKYIYRCIDSVSRQTFSDFELLLIDDGSTDGSEAVCDEYAENDSRVIVIHKRNGGVSNARNVGLDVAIGKYVAFCDGDDYFEDSLLEKSIFEMKKSNADIVTFWAKRTSIGGVKRDEELKNYKEVDLKENRESFLEDVVSWKTGGWQVWRSLFSKDLIQKHNIRFCQTCNDYAEDLCFMIEYLLYAHKNSFIDNELYIYDDIRENSMMNISKNKIRVGDVNEVSFFLFYKMKDIISKKTQLFIHHALITSEIGQLYSSFSMKSLSKYDVAINNISNLEYFIKRNAEYFQSSHGKMSFRDLKSQIKIVDRYLTDLNFEKLLLSLQFRKIVLFFGKIKGKLLGR